MKNVSSIKNNLKNESPKTPGGISKSLLTPCRRVGLSRNWKKKGPSPFISPLASNTSNNEPVLEKKETRKRKSVIESDEKSSKNFDSDAETDDCPVNSTSAEEIVKTPLRTVELPRRKKSKTFLASLSTQACTKANSSTSQEIDECTKENETAVSVSDTNVDTETPNTEGVGQVIKKVSPLRKNPKTPQKSKKFQSPLQSAAREISINENTVSHEVRTADNILETPKEVSKPEKKKTVSKPLKPRSPNELTKECIVVIQKKLLKVKEQYNKGDQDITDVPKKNSQPIFDSDDETPLSTLNKKEINKVQTPITTIDDDDDEFIETSIKNKGKKTENIYQKPSDSKKSSKADNKVQKPIKQSSKVIPLTESKPPSQSSFDDDDDFLDKKKTILIRKTYEKVSKLNKAKSTGSITQRDIDDLKARIELKKKMLLARSMTGETEELRSLIKKWQKGCQEALVELMDLMKIKCPDKHNMDYSEILQMLKIPASLVGYDSDHDCFNTPDDSSAVLSKYNDF